MGHQGMRTAVVLLLAAMMPLTGCTGQGTTEQTDAMASVSAAATANADTSDLKTDLGRKILEDGTVSDAEWAEAKDAYTQCLAGIGMTVEFENDRTSQHSTSGGWLNSIDPSKEYTDDEIHEMMAPETQCGVDTDFDEISKTRDFAEAKNKHGDTEEYLQSVVDCLVSNGLVGEGMTVEEYKQDMADADKRDAVFGKYIDSSNPDYDEQKKQQWQTCQDD